MVVRKGTNKGVDSYSGFGDAFGGRWEKTELADVLRAAGVTHVVCGGLATDFCVSFTAKDAVKNGRTPPCGATRLKRSSHRCAGFKTVLIEDAARGITPEGIEGERKQWAEVGVETSTTDKVLGAAGKRALIIIDVQVRGVAHTASALACASPTCCVLPVGVQNDFCAGGSLAVPDGDAVVPVLNTLREKLHWDLVVLTQDWHPTSATLRVRKLRLPLTLHCGCCRPHLLRQQQRGSHRVRDARAA